MIDNNKFIDKSLELFNLYNTHHLLYKSSSSYDKLVTADPFIITVREYEHIKNSGVQVYNWLQEQKRLFEDINQNSFPWLYNHFVEDIGETAFALQKLVNKHKGIDTTILRVDLSSFPFNSHEAQLRWAGLGHTHFITELHKKVHTDTQSESKSHNFISEVQKVIDQYSPHNDEYCLYLVPDKYKEELEYAAQITEMHHVLFYAPNEFNESNFAFKNGILIEKNTNRKIKLIIRRQLTLATLSQTGFGREVIHAYLDGKLNFEPGLNLINDMKTGMSLAFDPRTKDYFSQKSRQLFLKTAFFDKSLDSYNLVFDNTFKSVDEFITQSSKSKRKLIFKYGGSDLFKSFGSSEVYRLDVTTKKQLHDILEKGKDGIWILQELDHTRYSFRYVVGDYSNPQKVRIATNDNFSARFQIYFSTNIPDMSPINMTANLVNDHWKARFKISNQQKGEGALVTPIHVAVEHT